MKTIICIDRDGTIVYDKKYHLGRTNDWKKKIKILPKVVDGIKIINKLPDTGIYMITNQPGVAIKNFKLLTMERANNVCKEVQNRLKKKGADVDGYFVCPHASPSYTRKRKEHKFQRKLVCNCSCIKPALGMVFDALKAEGITKKNARVFVIGDRVSDIKTALNAGGMGVFIPFENEPEQYEKAKKNYKNRKRVYFAKDMVDAAQFIKRKVKK